MKNIKFVAMIVLCAMLLSSVCSAKALDRFTINDEKKELTIYGTPDGVTSKDNICIQILKLDKTSGDVSDEDTGETILGDYLLFTQILADSNGGYSKTVSMVDEDPGFYTIIVNGDENEICYASKGDRESIVEYIKDTYKSYSDGSLSQSDAIKDLAEKFDLDNNRSIWAKSFDLSDPIIALVAPVGENDFLFAKFLNYIPELTIDNLKEGFTEAAYITALNENKVNIIDVKDKFSLDEDYVAFYNSKLTETSKNEFMSEYFLGKGYDTVEKISDAFNGGVLESKIALFETAGEVESYIKEYGEWTGIDLSDETGYGSLTTLQKNAVNKYVLGFYTAKSIAEAANLKIKEVKDSGSGDSSEGGSSGNNSGGASSGASPGAAGGTTGGNPVISIEKVPEASEDIASSSSSFSDMAGFDWAIESVEALSKKGIINGKGNGKFEPESNVTREEILAMILRAFGINELDSSDSFSDSVANEWYAGYLAAAKANGFVSGKPDGSFGIGEAVTREDSAVMAYNIAKAKGMNFEIDRENNFVDDADMSEYAKDAIYALKNSEIINGKGEGIFAPKATCTRAEAAKIIYTLISK